MAGESPDRSKQRESSAEPTPGGGNPVPEARDPRLAVARADVDTTTKVLSTRALPPEEPPTPDDARLRAAVAAWVRSGSGEPRPTAEEPGVAVRKASAAEDTAEAEAAAETEGAADADGIAETEGAARTEGAAEIDGEPEDVTGDDSEAEGTADAESEAEDTSGDDSERENTADTESRAEGATGDDSDGEHTADAESEAEDTSGDDSERENTADTGPKAEGTAGAAADETGDAPGTDDDDPDEPAATSAEAEMAGDAEADKAPEASSDEQPEPEQEATPKADTAPGADKPTEPKSGAKSVPATDTDPESDTETDAGTDTEAAAAAAPKADERPKADADRKTDAGPKTDARPDAHTPADADGEDAPQGPPAVDDESRTGGAGGSESSDGEAEDAAADAPQGPVDHPTAVFKAPRPQVDQPTTTLKIGGAAKTANTANAPQADRTSKFVALKPLDATTTFPQVGPERTTQQPLPPKPPLDLLAELTNTPPPPQTPIRTLVRRVKIWTPLVALLAIIFAVVQTVRPVPQPALDLTAQDSYTFDGGKVDIPWPSQGQAALDVQGIGSFGSNGDQKPVPIASVAKVMTAYIILRGHPLKSGADGPKIKIDQVAQDQSRAGQESTVDVTAGDSITQREALESILIASANNVARLLARWDAGSEKAFVAKMNATAKDLGMTNTTYTDPSGLTNSTVSTAVDQVKLAKAAMEKPAFREVAAMMSYDDYKGVNHSNWNQLVGHNDVVGIKTGTTTSALGNLVFAAKKEVGGETRTIVGAVLRQTAGGPENTILSAALYGGDQLIRAAQGALRSATIIKKGAVVGYVDDGLGGRTPVVAAKDVTAAGWAGLKVKLSFTSDAVPHTAKAGTKVGTLTVGDGSGGAVAVPVALQKDLAEPGFTDKLTRLG
ncbi:D-alanyl-D-alanine carboxypeptidase [Streptomyces sp. NPDC001982]|uniref:D-alanyl-D-alanine carboxypeptidase n=1 Tax=Streptomyces sp. NPDC001982 TaxID=3154405 RepID=UPI00332A4899